MSPSEITTIISDAADKLRTARQSLAEEIGKSAGTANTKAGDGGYLVLQHRRVSAALAALTDSIRY